MRRSWRVSRREHLGEGILERTCGRVYLKESIRVSWRDLVAECIVREDMYMNAHTLIRFMRTLAYQYPNSCALTRCDSGVPVRIPQRIPLRIPLRIPPRQGIGHCGTGHIQNAGYWALWHGKRATFCDTHIQSKKLKGKKLKGSIGHNGHCGTGHILL